MDEDLEKAEDRAEQFNAEKTTAQSQVEEFERDNKKLKKDLEHLEG